MDNYIGKRLDGRYEITELIGQGGENPETGIFRE